MAGEPEEAVAADEHVGLPESVRRAHDEAVERGEGMYKDPLSPNWVMTSAALSVRGYCCGSGCRHCPYDAET